MTSSTYTTPVGDQPAKNVRGGLACTRIGHLLRPDGWGGFGTRLERGDEPIPGTWAGSQYRVPISPTGPVVDYPINIELTSRTVAYRDGVPMMRCRVEWIRDGEPSDFDGAWVQVDIL